MSEITRRDFLKAVVPGAWAVDLKRGGGLGGLSPAGQIGLVKDVLLFTSGVAYLVIKEKVPASFKERIEVFDWDRAEGKELEVFTNAAADEYLRLTGTNRVTRQDLTATHFFGNRGEFVNAVRNLGFGFTLTDRTWGATDFSKKQVFIDTAKLKDTFFPLTPKGFDSKKAAGRAFLQALWHEWGRLDITERKEGQFLNKPQYFFESPYSGTKEPFRKYIGGAIFTDTYFGYTRFESVWNNTIALRRMMEQVDLDWVFAAGEYFQNGSDIFVNFTRAVGMPLETMYQMHSTSDFEGFMDLVGQKLPGNEPPLVKGERLVTAIHKSDRQLLEQTGVLSLLPKR